jgi:hypothetical protein
MVKKPIKCEHGLYLWPWDEPIPKKVNASKCPMCSPSIRVPKAHNHTGQYFYENCPACEEMIYGSLEGALPRLPKDASGDR